MNRMREEFVSFVRGIVTKSSMAISSENSHNSVAQRSRDKRYKMNASVDDVCKAVTDSIYKKMSHADASIPKIKVGTMKEFD
jgi:hypothetical protein